MEEKFDVLNDNGLFTGEVVTRDECHTKGLWHRAIVVFIINSKDQVLLQQRSSSKKVWPNLWDISAGGHVLEGEFGIDAAIRETKEELALDIKKEDLLYIGSTISFNKRVGMIDNHFNEYYIVNMDLDIKNLKLQKDEVQNVKWFDKKDIIKRLHNNYEDITDKTGCWEYLERYLNSKNKK